MSEPCTVVNPASSKFHGFSRYSKEMKNYKVHIPLDDNPIDDLGRCCSSEIQDNHKERAYKSSSGNVDHAIKLYKNKSLGEQKLSN